MRGEGVGARLAGAWGVAREVGGQRGGQGRPACAAAPQHAAMLSAPQGRGALREHVACQVPTQPPPPAVQHAHLCAKGPAADFEEDEGHQGPQRERLLAGGMLRRRRRRLQPIRLIRRQWCVLRLGLHLRYWLRQGRGWRGCTPPEQHRHVREHHTACRRGQTSRPWAAAPAWRRSRIAGYHVLYLTGVQEAIRGHKNTAE